MPTSDFHRLSALPAGPPANVASRRWTSWIHAVLLFAAFVATTDITRATRDITATTDALTAYAERAGQLRRQAIATGAVSYLDVLNAAYGPGAISREVFQAKAEWRGNRAAGLVFATDYSGLLDRATVGLLTPVADPALRSTLVAQYESLAHRIGIAPLASDFAIFHEAGHALQRATLRTRGSADSRRSPFQDALHGREHSTLDTTALRRLEYLCSQVELEVRLQDLNRFHALITGGRPILEPRESVGAMMALGIPLAYEEVRDAFLVAGEALSVDEFAAIAARPAPLDAGRLAIAFEDARELRIIRRLAMRLDAACWTPLLAKILFEAPGHL